LCEKGRQKYSRKKSGKNIKTKLNEKRDRQTENEQRILGNQAGIENTKINQNVKTGKYKPG
jgi:hypothetical protein